MADRAKDRPEGSRRRSWIGRYSVSGGSSTAREPALPAPIEGKEQTTYDRAPSSPRASVTILPRVLEKIPVMIFAGDQDLICNYVGLEAMMQGMAWNGATGLGVRIRTLYQAKGIR